MTGKSNLSTSDVQALAKLAGLSLSANQTDEYQKQFNNILDLVSQINSFDTSNTAVTNQVTGLQNVFREDIAQPDKCLSQKKALQNAEHTHQGYVVVDRLIED